MPWSVNYIAQQEIVQAVAVGKVDNEDFDQLLEQIVHRLRQHHSQLALVDCSSALSEATLPALYYLPDKAALLKAPWLLRIALVGPSNGYRGDTYRFTELIFRSNGYDFRLFDTRKQAEDWLLHPPPKNSPPLYLAHV